jgi:predicted RNase H-like HicB family nuclease
MKIQAKELNVLLFPQKSGDNQLWVAQCVDRDFAAQGATIEQAKANFSSTVDTHIALCLKHGEEPFVNVPPAPAWFQRDFEMIKNASDTEIVGDRTPIRRMIFKHAFAGV